MSCYGYQGSRAHEEQDPTADSVNPILRTYLAAGTHGTCKRYTLELLLVAGLLLPWLGPLLGLAVLDPSISVALEESKVVTPSTQCYGTGPTVCNATSYFDYYFWNITNAEQWMTGQPPIFQELGPYAFLVSEFRFNVQFSDDFRDVEYSNYNFQQFVPDQSCKSCSLNDTFVGVNRAYQAVLQTTGGYETPILVASVPLVLDGLIDGYTAAIEQYGAPPAVAAQLAIQQWSTCSVFPTPSGLEFCNWAQLVAGLAPPNNTLPVPVATTLLSAFRGNASKHDATGVDPAAKGAVLGFAYTPAALLSAELFLPVPIIQLVQEYLVFLATTAVAPGFQAILGPVGGPNSGGLVAARPINQWLYGWTDPVLGATFGSTSRDAQVAVGFAWETQTAPQAALKANTSDLSYKLSPLIFQRKIRTGRAAGDMPTEALQQDNSSVVTSSADVPLPGANITIHGSNGGLLFGLNLNVNSTLTLLDGSWLRPVNTSYTGRRVDVKGISTLEFGLKPEAYAACNHSLAEQLGDRCAYPDLYRASWNASLTYACPTLLTLAHFHMADQSLANSTGSYFAPNSSQHGWTFGVEPATGFTLMGHKTYQVNHRVTPMDVFYPHLWMNPESPDGMWVPSFWVRSRFEPADKDANSLRSVIKLQSLFKLLLAYVAPGISGVLLLPAIYFLFMTKTSREASAAKELITKSRARNLRVSPAENEHVVALTEDMAADPDSEAEPLTKGVITSTQAFQVESIPAVHDSTFLERVQNKAGKAPLTATEDM